MSSTMSATFLSPSCCHHQRPSITPVAQWEVESNGDWQPLAKSVSASLEKAYLTWQGGGPHTHQFGSGKLDFTVNFAEMIQVNNSDKDVRAVRREEFFTADDVTLLECALECTRGPWLIGGTGGLALRNGSGIALEALADRLFAMPSYPLTSKGSEYARLPDRDPRKQWLESYFLSSLQEHRRAMGSEEWSPKPEIDVLDVAEFYHEASTRAYRYELGELVSTRENDHSPVPELDMAIRVRTNLGGPRVNEALLFHGCDWRVAKAIQKEGFDPRLGGTNAGALFGIGSYFTTVASKADYYTQKWVDVDPSYCPDSRKLARCMCVARVALGEIYEARESDRNLRRPPIAPDGHRYDSVLGVPRSRGGCVDHDEFITYKAAQAVLQYMVLYQHKDSCACRTCTRPRA